MRELKTAIYQYEATSELESAAARLDRLEAVLFDSSRDLDLVVCPELFVCGYFIGAEVHQRAEAVDGPSAQRISEIAIKHKLAIAAGYSEKDGDHVYNSVIVIGSDGEQLVNYRKRVIPPGFEGAYFTPGESPCMFELKGWKIATLICYDVEFPEFVRHAALGGAEVMVVPTALRSQWGFVADTMLPTRAFENGAYVLYANYAGAEGDCEYLGRSVILAPDGSELARAGDRGGLIYGTLNHSAIDKARSTLPYHDVIRAGLPGH